MRSTLYLSFILALVLFSANAKIKEPTWLKDLGNMTIDGVKGSGYGCPICTALVFLMEQYAVLHSMNFDDFVNSHVCKKLLKGEAADVCELVVGQFGEKFLYEVYSNISPDAVCRKLGVCSNPECNLVPKGSFPKIQFSESYIRQQSSTTSRLLRETLYEELGTSWWQKIVEKINYQIMRFVNEKRPDFDLDGDSFSGSVGQTRGFHWRGRDCFDDDPTIYPGRKTDSYDDPDIDYNCNGIYGTHPGTGKSWESELCGDSIQLGYAVIGDSAGAHFEIPPQWFNASDWNETTFTDIIPRALDELDLPHWSGWTGYEPDTNPNRPCRSIYQYMYQHNQCNFRDYQNTGVNGASSSNDYPTDIEGIQRNQNDDYPMIVFMEFIGNDVCGSEQDFTHMTTPVEFKANIINLLNYLDTVLPAGSHVVSVGLADGALLYEELQNATHPIGVGYPIFYDYLNCLEVSPCWGWMNSNATVRNTTNWIAQNLTDQYKEIIADGLTWSNFDYTFYEFPADQILTAYQQAGGSAASLIEPVDGFHPGQIFNALVADWYWNALQTNQAEWFGPVNPNNAFITQLFGDQGGY
jgi:acyloxyacyl hydrolase